MIPCLSKTLFGIECLGCGFQRAVVLLLQGELKASFLLYPALFPLLLFFGTIGISFINTSKNYIPILKILGLISLTTMLLSYFFKHFPF